MPLNLLKIYPQLLDLTALNEPQRNISLLSVFKRDIEDNPIFKFRTKTIRPIKGEEPSMQILFRHLTTEEIEDEEDGKTLLKRVFELDRSQRLHWIKHHIEENIKKDIEIFSVEERKNGSNVNHTYIYNTAEKYVIVLEPQKSGMDYYLLTAYYLNRSYGEKMIKKKMKKKLTFIA